MAVLRAKLLTGSQAKYLRQGVAGGVGDTASTLSDHTPSMGGVTERVSGAGERAGASLPTVRPTSRMGPWRVIL